MAESNSQGLPAVAFRFELRLDDLLKAGGFNDCSGIDLETEVEEYFEGGLNTHAHVFAGRTSQSRLILKRGFVDRVLHDWYLDIVEGKFQRKNGSIFVYDASGQNVEMEWQFQRAFPCKWNGPTLNAQQNSIAIESIELCHEGLKRRK